MTTLFFALFLLLVHLFWPEGSAFLKTLLIPGDPETTIEAVEVFAQELNCGASIQDAARDLYQRVILYD